MAKDRAAGSRSLGEHGFHGLGRGSRPLSGASGRINLAIYWGTLRRQLLSRLGGTRQQPDYCLYCRWGRQALPGAHGRHDLELYGAALQREFLSRLGAARRQSNHSINWRGGGRCLSDAQRRLALAIHQHATFWQYTGPPCYGNSCPGWLKLDDNPSTLAIFAAGAHGVYQQHRTGSIWQYPGPPCTGNSCPGWVALDNNPETSEIFAGGDLYEQHLDHSIWQYTGTPCNGNSRSEEHTSELQ